MAYAELLTRSCYSLLDGASQPEELCEAAIASGVAHLGLADRDGVYGLVQAHQVARQTGLHLVCGSTVTVLDHPGVALLVQDRKGWSNLCRLLTRGRGLETKGRSVLPLSSLLELNAGLLCVLRPGYTPETAAPLREAFEDRLYIAVWRDLTPGDPHRVAAAQELARALGSPLLATNDVRMHARSRRPLSDVLTCIRRKTTLQQAGRALAANAERVLLPEAEFRARYRDLPEAIQAAWEAACRCTFSLSELKYGYPEESVPEGYTAMSWLRELTRRGLMWRYPQKDGGVPEKIKAIVDHELQVVEELGYANYFLTVFDVVRFARSRGILCQGRGSAANSAICYALGITAVDPNRIELLFERFISRERAEPPDIDVDFEHERREEVIQYIYSRYGRERAGMVNEFITYRQRSAIREAGKAFGLSLDQVDRLARAMDGWSAGLPGTSGARAEGSVDALIREAGLDPASPEVKGTLRIASQLEGLPRHLSIHVGGFVIAERSLVELVPIEPAAMEDRTVLQWDKYDVEALGFVKVDILGLGMLTAIRRAFELIAGAGGPKLTLATVPAEDPAVYDLFCKADTVGIFQIESRAQMSMLPRLKPRCFYDLVVQVAIVRPGPIQGGMVHPYLRRRSGAEPVTYPHPALVPILQRTLGVPLFQEQVMAMAVAVGGFTPGEADRLRRAMGSARKRATLVEMGQRLMRGMTERGIPREYAEQVFQQILGFGEYGFPESHAASFALLVYVSGWLKVHWPAAFAAALINAQPMGFYSPRVILSDAQRRGVEVRPVCVVRSSWDCTLEPSPEGPAIRLGFRLLRGMVEADATAIVSARKQRASPFDSLAAFARATGLEKSKLQTLAEAGAFEAIAGPDRRKAAWVLQGLWTDLPLFAGLQRREPEPPLPALSAFDKLKADYRTTGLSVDLHPIALLRSELEEMGVVCLSELQELESGAAVRVAGLVSSRQRPPTSNGVVFLALEDETGLGNLVIWPAIWREHHALARSAQMLGVDGRVQRQGEAISVLVERFWALPGPDGGSDPLSLGVRSRDFR